MLIVGSGLVGLTLAALIVLGSAFFDRSKGDGQARVTPDEKKNEEKPEEKKTEEKKPEDKKTEEKKTEEKLPTLISPDRVYKKLLKSVVWIIASDGKDVWTGSGSLIDLEDRLIITNQHVANKTCRTIRVLFPEYDKKGEVISDRGHYENRISNSFAATLVKADWRRDLAVIRLESPPPKDMVPLRIARINPSPGQAIHTLGGTPKGSEGQWIFSSGMVRQVSFAEWSYQGDQGPRSAELIDSQVPTNPGDSGAAVVDARCVMVGVHAMGGGGLLTVKHIAISEVRDFLKTIGKDPPDPGDAAPTAVSDAEIDKAIKQLKEEDGKHRRQAALKLAEFGPVARRAVPELLRVLRSRQEEKDVQAGVEVALGELGLPSKDQIPDLINALRDVDAPRARVYAADVLGKLGADAKPALADLVNGLDAAESDVRRSVASALGKIGRFDRDAVFAPLLRTIKAEKEREVRVAAGHALLALGNPEPGDAGTLKSLLADRVAPREGRVYAAWGLGRLGTDYIPNLLDAIDSDSDAGVVVVSVEQLGLLGVKSKKINEALTKCVARSEPAIRVMAATSLGQLGVQDVTLPGILKALDNTDPACRQAILDTLPPFGTFNRKPSFNLSASSVDELRAALKSEQRIARLFAAYALGTLGEEASAAVPELGKAIQKEGTIKLDEGQPFNFAQMEMIMAIGEIGASAKEVAPTLREIFKDTTIPKQIAYAAALVYVPLIDKAEEKAEAYKVIAKALLLGGQKTVGTVDKELLDRAKKSLQKGGKIAYKAMSTIQLFDGPGNDKAYARLCCYQIWGQMSRQEIIDVRKDKALRDDLNRILIAGTNRQEPQANQEAAKDAWNNIFGK
jgi:HEAT repeat protein/S1-C subfamily serine protease